MLRNPFKKPESICRSFFQALPPKRGRVYEGHIASKEIHTERMFEVHIHDDGIQAFRRYIRIVHRRSAQLCLPASRIQAYS